VNPKQYLIEAISNAADNAHDMGIDHGTEHAVGDVVTTVLWAPDGLPLDYGPFTGLEDLLFEAGLALREDIFTKQDVMPHLIDAIREFLEMEKPGVTQR
jgi:hypothetical protein